MNLEDLTVEIRHINIANGWRDRWEHVLRTTEGAGVRDHIAAKLALIHSEISEALEVLRDGHDPRDTWTADGTDDDTAKPEGFPIELADVVIRTIDLADTLDINLADAINWKLHHNRGRGHMHGGKKL